MLVKRKRKSIQFLDPKTFNLIESFNQISKQNKTNKKSITVFEGNLAAR